MEALVNFIQLSTPYQIKEVQDKAKYMYLETYFILGSDSNQYEKLIKDLQN